MKKFLFTRKDNLNKVKNGLLRVVVLLSIVAGSYGEEPTLVIENAHVIVGNGVVKDAATVVIAADRIQNVSTENPELKNVKKIDASANDITQDENEAISYGMSCILDDSCLAGARRREIP